MARRIWKDRFSFYIQLIYWPNFLIAVAFMAAPEPLLGYMFPQTEGFAPETEWLGRLFGVAFFILGIIFQGGRKEPGRHRAIFFWFALLFLALSGLVILAIILYGLTYWASGIIIVWLPAAVLLLMFASKNLHVRE